MPRPASLAAACAVLVLACQGDAPAPRAKAQPAPGVPGPPSTEFELTAPKGFRRVPAPEGILGAWEAEAQPNGFTPTLRIAKEPALSPDTVETCDAWRTRALALLGKTYVEVKVIGGANTIEGPAAPGCLLIAKVGVPMPHHDGAPMPLVAFAAAYPRGAELYTLAAMTSMGYDVASGQAAPLHEMGLLRTIVNFKTTAPASKLPTP